MADMQFDWRGPEVQAQVIARVDQELIRIGTFAVGRMQAYAPVDTGRLRTGIHDQFDAATHTLTVYSPAPYSVYQEFGTRFIKPHPYIRPAIDELTARWSFANVELILRPPGQISEPIRATTSGFRLPRRQPLTAEQTAHVRKHLTSVSRKYARKFRRRGVSYKVTGP